MEDIDHTQRPFFIIRLYDEKTDKIGRQKVIFKYIMSQASDIFTESLFREAFYCAVFLLVAFLFIFVHLPLLGCISSVPLLVIALYVSLHAMYYMKAEEKSRIPVGSENVWVVETFNRWLTGTPKDFDLMPESHVHTINRRHWKIKIIGTISLHEGKMNLQKLRLNSYGYIKDFALVDPFCETSEGFQRIAVPLIEHVLAFAHQKKYEKTETETNECNTDLREALIEAGFYILQCYHKYFFIKDFSLCKYMMTILQADTQHLHEARDDS